MGCCKSKEKVKNEEIRDSLIKINENNEENLINEENRGLSLQRNFSPFLGLLNITNEEKKEEKNDEKKKNESNNYKPPLLISKQQQQQQQQKKLYFNGKTILKPPHLNDLQRKEWINKRGHVVKNWKKRFIVLIGDEISYYEKCDSNGNGTTMKGQIHLLGATCDLKILNKKKSIQNPTEWIIEVISKREDNKDLLLSFESISMAYDWYDAITWSIYLANTRYINLINLRSSNPNHYHQNPTKNSSSSNAPSSSSKSNLIQEIEKWYMKQSYQFEDNFNVLSSGCQFFMTSYSHLTNQSLSNDNQKMNCFIMGQRENLTLSWCFLYPQSGFNETNQSSISSKFKRSEMKSYLLKDIQDILIGKESYQNHEKGSDDDDDDDENDKNDNKSESKGNNNNNHNHNHDNFPTILKIKTLYHTINLIYSSYPPDSKTERWIQSLLSILHYLSIPIIIKETDHTPTIIQSKKSMTAFQATEKITNLLVN